jgi:hypothetical protein
VHDGVQVGQRLAVVEHPVGHRGPVERAVGGHDARAEALDHRREHGRVRSLHVAHDGVGVDNDRPPFGQQRRHGRLPRPDPPGEPDDQHARGR